MNTMQEFKDELIPLVREAIAANSHKPFMSVSCDSHKEFIEFSSGSFKCRVRLDRLKRFLKELDKLPGRVGDPTYPTHKQNLNKFNRAACVNRLEQDNY